MSTRRFAQLAAQLYPFTEQNPTARDEQMRDNEKPLAVARYGLPTFGGLTQSETGVLQVVVNRQFSYQQSQPGPISEGVAFEGKFFSFPQASTEITGTMTHHLPVRAFIKLARAQAEDAQMFDGIDKNLRAQGADGLVNLNTLAPVYRDGLLALAQELQRRKSYVRTGCTSVEM